MRCLKQHAMLGFSLPSFCLCEWRMLNRNVFNTHPFGTLTDRPQGEEGGGLRSVLFRSHVKGPNRTVMVLISKQY